MSAMSESVRTKSPDAGYNDATVDARGNIWAAGFYREVQGPTTTPNGKGIWNTDVESPPSAYQVAPTQIFADSNCDGYLAGKIVSKGDGAEQPPADFPYVAKIRR